MEDRDGKKPFIIPKTHTSTKDVLISEKTDSRNVIELFNDIKSCSLELHYDFRQNQCKSCDLIRNQKLQKSYNERKIQLKKDHDPTERFAFHLITSRETAINIATDGLSCEQLSFSIEKYLGNPKDGIHLSRRPDVLLASSGAQGFYKFGLLVCKIILGKGYATIPSINNKELSAQLHYDYHFCKIQTVNKEQRHIDDLLGNSLIFCYEHKEFQTQSSPSQILPLAILWYDLTEKFPSDLTPTSQESQQRKLKPSFKKKPIPPVMTGGTWEEPIPDTPVQTTPTKYPNQFMIPYSSLYTSFGQSQTESRLIRKLVASETIPLSPQNSISDLSPTLKQFMNERKLPSKTIPLDFTTELIDPRLKTVKQTHHIFYLESTAVKHAVQQQKRLNNYYGTKSKTNYTLIPFQTREISSDDYERNKQLLKNTSPLLISVIDCFQFGLKKSSEQSYVDLEENENQIAYEQIQRSDQLIEQERQLNSQEIRLYLREKRQRKLQEQIDEQRKIDLADAKIYIHNGRKLLKEHQENNSSNNQISLELLDFFSYEYRNEDRPHVKRILAELIGIFVEKYGLDYTQMISKTIEALLTDNQTFNSVIDMDLESPSSQGLADRDERFPAQTPPICTEPPPSSSFLIQTSNETNITFDESNNNITQLVQSTQNEISVVEPTVLTNDEVTASPSEEVQSEEIIIPGLLIEIEDNSNRSRDELVKLLTKEAFTSKSPSPTEIVNPRRRFDEDDDESANSNTKPLATRTVTLVSKDSEDSLIIKTINTDQQEAEEEEPTVKRIKVDSIPPPPNEEVTSLATPSDDRDYRQDLDERRKQEEILRSRSQSTSSHNSSVKESKSSSRAPSTNNHRYRQPRRYEQDRSYRYQQRNNTSSRHQRFNYNHQSVADHPRFAHVDVISSPEKNYNYNSFSTSNYSQNLNVNSSSYYNDTQSDYSYYNNNNFPQPPPLMSATPLMNYSNSYDSKPSNTIERLQMFLENRNTSYDYSSSSSYQMHSSENSNHHQWSSSRYPSSDLSNRTMENNQTFTCNDAEQLLTFVQRLRN